MQFKSKEQTWFSRFRSMWERRWLVKADVPVIGRRLGRCHRGRRDQLHRNVIRSDDFRRLGTWRRRRRKRVGFRRRHQRRFCWHCFCRHTRFRFQLSWCWWQNVWDRYCWSRTNFYRCRQNDVVRNCCNDVHSIQRRIVGFFFFAYVGVVLLLWRRFLRFIIFVVVDKTSLFCRLFFTPAWNFFW